MTEEEWTGYDGGEYGRGDERKVNRVEDKEHDKGSEREGERGGRRRRRQGEGI